MHTPSSENPPKAATPLRVFCIKDRVSKPRIVLQRPAHILEVAAQLPKFVGPSLQAYMSLPDLSSGKVAEVSPKLRENSVPQLQSFQTMTNLLSRQLLIQNQCQLWENPNSTASYCRSLTLPDTTFQKRSNWLLRVVEMLQANSVPVRPWSKASSMATRMASYWPGSKEPEACQSPLAWSWATKRMKSMRRLLPCLWRAALPCINQWCIILQVWWGFTRVAVKLSMGQFRSQTPPAAPSGSGQSKAVSRCLYLLCCGSGF